MLQRISYLWWSHVEVFLSHMCWLHCWNELPLKIGMTHTLQMHSGYPSTADKACYWLKCVLLSGWLVFKEIYIVCDTALWTGDVINMCNKEGLSNIRISMSISIDVTRYRESCLSSSLQSNNISEIPRQLLLNCSALKSLWVKSTAFVMVKKLRQNHMFTSHILCINTHTITKKGNCLHNSKSLGLSFLHPSVSDLVHVQFSTTYNDHRAQADTG